MKVAPLSCKHPLRPILGAPGAVSGGGEKSKTGEKKIRAKKSQERDFLRPNFFSPVLDFSPSPLTARGSPRMPKTMQFFTAWFDIGKYRDCNVYPLKYTLEWVNVFSPGIFKQFFSGVSGAPFDSLLDSKTFNSTRCFFLSLGFPFPTQNLTLKERKRRKHQKILNLRVQPAGGRSFSLMGNVTFSNRFNTVFWSTFPSPLQRNLQYLLQKENSVEVPKALHKIKHVLRLFLCHLFEATYSF